MRLRMLVVAAVLLAVALPAQARAGGFSGIVVAKHRGTILLAGAHGVGLTVRGGVGGVRVGQRVEGQGVRLRDGTIRLSHVQGLARVRTATLRGTVLRRLARGMLFASGRSVVLIHRPARQVASASDHGGLQAGDVASVRVRFDDDQLVQAAPPTQLGQSATARIEGAVVSLSPFVVSLEGLPVTIALPAGMTLPATLAAGQQVELTVQVGDANAFTLVSIDDLQAQEVEVTGLVTSSTATEIVVDGGGTTATFAAPAGTTLPVLPVGTPVEVRGVQQNGTTTLTRLRVDDTGDGGDHGGGDG